ncbi:MAG: type IV conjugative transfer system lipoprotein TraV [Rhodocyclaceae bacterium]|nr:type IV conjugative transfer system lipoprotein TraV [Rhodocyclaceae bacterium]
MRNLPLLAIAILGVGGLNGCAGTMSGMTGSDSKFACKAPDGVTCSSLSGVYANAVANNLPALRKDDKGDASGKAAMPPSPGEVVGHAPSSGDPIRSQPKILRVWIAPWEDTDGDLHDQSYVYVVADPGRWMLEHNQKQIIDRYRPTFLSVGRPQKQAPASQKPAAPSGGTVVPGNPSAQPQVTGGSEEQ